MYYKRKFNEWVKIVDDLFEVPDRLKELSIVEKKELVLHLDERRLSLLKIVLHRVTVEKKHPDFNTPLHLEHSKRNCFEYGYNYYAIENMIQYVTNDIERYNKIVDDPIFEPNIAKDFFDHCIENWISKTRYKKTALSYLFNQMWHERNVIECQYKIKVSSTAFAKYWNIEYFEKTGLELDLNNPKFKKSTDITTSTHESEFNKMLDTFSA